jgi:hypothetical protein
VSTYALSATLVPQGYSAADAAHQAYVRIYTQMELQSMALA